MKFKYKKEVMDEVELEVPYYYEEISGTEYKMFGKIGSQTEGLTEISFGDYRNSKTAGIEKYSDPTEHIDYILRYCTESTKQKFDNARKKVLDYLK